MIDLNKLTNALYEEAAKHRRAAEDFRDSNAIWTARVAACHVLNSLAIAVLESKQ